MTRKLIKFTSILISILIFLIFYLSFFGINTDKFNDKIKSEITKINKKISLELKDVTILLNPFNFTINFKTYGPNIIVGKQKVKLHFIKTNVSLKSIINKNFSIDDVQISTKEVKLDNIILLMRSFDNSTELFILGSMVKKGTLIGDINLKFNDEGKIKKDYEIKGFIRNSKIKVPTLNEVDNLNFNFKIKDKEYQIDNIKVEYNKIKLFSKVVKIKRIDKLFFIEGQISNEEKNINIDILNNLFKNFVDTVKFKNLIVKLENNFSFNINDKFHISNFELNSKINLDQLDYNGDLKMIKSYLPTIKNLVKFNEHIINLSYKNDRLFVKGMGDISVESNIDKINYEITKVDKKYFFDTSLNFNKNPILLSALQYKKKKNTESLLRFKGDFQENDNINFELISFKERNNNFIIKDLNLNKKLKIRYFDLIEIDYINNKKINNQLQIKKNKENYEIKGKSFDASNLINTLLDIKNDNSTSLFNKLNSKIKINIKKTYLDESNFIENLNGTLAFRDNKINNLKLLSNFKDGKKIQMSINISDEGEKITTLDTDYPKPLIQRYKFIKGYEEGTLAFTSIKKNGVSNSELRIDNFKVKEVPVLAKLLSLASLQGIADLLTGEGIRFSDFDMSFSNQGSLITINEIYAIGPAISIMMDGYIENKKLISLRGTLVPATTINRTIASIPLIGNILVGKKIGEGVFGVSFKIKGPPKNLKTTVNPIKTLTPRFITRTLEKIKKN